MAEPEDWEEEYTYEEEAEEEETCAEGFGGEESCSPWLRLGIEYCEFMCPWDVIDKLYKSTSCAICGARIKKGDILCPKHAAEEWG